jgi:isoleucyl-tRNA synthetase
MVKDLKDTLNLPKTQFPMRANLVTREPERIAHWDKVSLYEAIQTKNAAGPLFVLHDGPPFTNGDVHIGTALNKIPKDLILRYKSMRGCRTPYVPGWDCHGLPIEHKVAKELRESGKSLSTVELRDACADFSRRYIEKQRGQFKRLGVLADWPGEYKTMDPAYEADILRAFASFVEQGLVYRAKKPIYWSIPCETALAEFEIEYKDHTSPSIWVNFALSDPAKLDLPDNASVVIWTTTPWTLPANLAVAVHPDLEYAAVGSGEGVFVVAGALVDRFAGEVGLTSHRVLKTFRGRELEGVETRHPFIDRPSPIVLAEYVTTESGTGCVHTAPGHGVDDYITGQAYNLPAYCPLDDQGRYVADGQVPEDLVGVTVLETDGKCPANDAVLARLRETGTLLKMKRLQHSYPHCWRSKTPVIFRAMDQWFVALDQNGVRQKALEAIGKVKWVPEWGENRIRGTVEARPDWCISRQRAWGVPIPVFYDDDGQPLLEPDVIRALAEKIQQHGTQLWFQSEPEALLAGIDLPAAWKSQKLHKGTDTLDVWIDSGVSHLAVLKKRPELRWPADLYLEGSDQHRGWFQSSLLTSVIVTGEAPYHQVLTHGFVVGQDGKKISKSDGKPQTADYFVGKFGADIIRLWVASIDFRNDVPISEEILKYVADSYRTLRNTLRFQISNLFDFDPAVHAVDYGSLDAIDRWALHQTALLVRQVTEAYEAYEFHRVYQLLTHFCTVTLSATYHDLLKDRLYTFAAGSAARRSSQTAIHHIFRAVVRLLAPVLTFTADEAWAYAENDADFAGSSVHLQEWPVPPAEWTDANLDGDIGALLKFREEVNDRLETCRQNKEIGKSLDAAVSIGGKPEAPVMALLRRYESFLPELFIVSQVELNSQETDRVDVSASHAQGCRCPRCWRWVPALSQVSEGVDVCSRCAEAV